MGLLTRLAIWIGSFAWLPPYLPTIVKADRLLWKATGGRVDFLTIAGLPSVTMTVAGRRSGVPRTTTVLAARDGDDWFVAGSHFGAPKSPAWVFNVRAAGTVVVRHVNGDVRMSAAELSGDARAHAWRCLLGVWPNFRLYEERTDRLIPVFRLSGA